MIRFFGIMGLLGAVTFLVLLIISIFRKTPKQKWVIGILASVLFISFSIIISFNSDMDTTTKTATSILREIDPVLEYRVYEVLEQIGITDKLHFKIEEELRFDEMGENDRLIVFSTEYKKVKANILVALDEKEWMVLFIGDFKPQWLQDPNFYWRDHDIKFYWINPSMAISGADIYDWETGRLVYREDN
jgi:hypothetical protein